ncbi:DUF2218 domain-containing protein [Hyphococcus sp.]|uniref:DUF2218 domain-containing protein n=1 Tax=Hyphococcus sp. TaxID=2038636 RepID=UPI0035C75031
MTVSASAFVKTENASKYLQQLCKHGSHNLAVIFDAPRGRVVCPKDARGASWPGDAVTTFTANDEGLECRIDATAAEQLEGLEGAVARHLDRFAFREAPLTFDWRAA